MKQRSHYSALVTQVTVPRESHTERFLEFMSWTFYKNTVSCVTSVIELRFCRRTQGKVAAVRPVGCNSLRSKFVPNHSLPIIKDRLHSTY